MYTCCLCNYCFVTMMLVHVILKNRGSTLYNFGNSITVETGKWSTPNRHDYQSFLSLSANDIFFKNVFLKANHQFQLKIAFLWKNSLQKHCKRICISETKSLHTEFRYRTPVSFSNINSVTFLFFFFFFFR